VKRFLYQIAGITGQQLNMDAARQLKDLAEFEGLLMLQAEFTGGATVRGTELVSTLIRNTTLSLRNTMGITKYISLIRQYNKTSNIAQRDCLTPHALAGLVGNLLVQLHTLTRPFAQVSSFFQSTLSELIVF
jgi:hypothetical protein